MAHAVVVQRIHYGRLTWGIDAPEGFAGYGEGVEGREGAESLAARYNSGDTQWAYSPKHKHPRVLRIKAVR